jgi:hypothetical protein
MREQEIRRILACVCRDIDLAARRSAGPAALGATLFVAAGCGGENSLYSAPVDDGGTDAADSGSDGGGDAGTVTPVYSAPVTDAGSAVDSGPVTKYGVPVVDSGPVLEYMAPFDAGQPVPAYLAAPVLDYMAPLPPAD